jgi:PKD repeat protein
MMKLIYSLFILFFLSITCASAQEQVLKATNRQKLRELAQEYEQNYFQNYQKAVQVAQLRGEPIIIKYKDGSQAYLDGITDIGQLLYIKNDNNTIAARTTSADKIQAGGRMGLYLSGKDMKAGVWEVGTPNLSHQEYIGRVSQLDNAPTETSVLAGNHANHVIGTIIAAGVNPVARGMAFQARVDSYSSANDDAEMTTSASNGLLISNHSYGIIRGWHNGNWNGNENISKDEDYLFGFYDNEARSWDQIAFNAPFYLICKSAGNERGDTGNQAGITTEDGNGGTGYDCIAHNGVSKNVLTVGAVNAVTNYNGPNSVIMSSFSSWGPTDDGRIKPDLVAQGVAVVSSIGYIAGNPITTTNTGYESLQGTSMSSPNAAGSLLLLQELHRDLNNGNFMRSATLKGLAIHTCLEAGTSPGPDYSFGWGLLNVENAANVLLKKDNQSYIVDELNLTNGQTFERTFSSDGSAPIIATICWTDPAGTPVSPQLDPQNLMLVNDLDMRVIAPNGTTTHFPWRLDPSLPSPASPTATATQGDNTRDNVEKIEILNPTAGTYTLRITHKKTTLVNNQQNFSLILTTQAIQNQRKALYWIGRAGNWNDGAKWSLTSGGSAANQVPTLEDVVIFDNNSFNADNQVVSVTANAQCFSFGWFSNRDANLQFNGNTLEVNGSFQRSNNTLIFNDLANIKLSGSSAKLTNIILENPDLPNANFMVDANNSTTAWSIKNPINIKGINLQSGVLNLNGNNLGINELVIGSNKSKTLNLSGRTLENLQKVEIAGTNLNLTTTNSILKFKNATGAASNQLIANHTFNEVNNAGGGLEITGNNTFQNLVLETSSSLVLANGSNQLITNNLDLKSTANNPMPISAKSGSASITANNTRRFCFNHLNISNVNALGQTKFVAGSNSTLTNTTGWVSANCADLVFADFTAKFLCAGGISEFTNTSTGAPTQFNWNFNVAAGNTNTSTQTNPNFTYTQAGDYQVRLNVSKGADNDAITKNLTVITPPSNIGKPTITYQDDLLRSSISAQNHQWYLNGNPIEGATSFFYSTTNPGNYVVEISNTQCKFRSDPFVITSLEDVQVQEAKNTTQLYPNPSTETMNLRFDNRFRGKVKVEMLDIVGKPMQTLSGNKNDEVYTMPLKINHLHAGIYLLKINLAGIEYTQKIIKQ